jgi:hypothetical protein
MALADSVSASRISAKVSGYLRLDKAVFFEFEENTLFIYAGWPINEFELRADVPPITSADRL